MATRRVDDAVDGQRTRSRALLAGWLVLALVAGYFRFTHLGYSEFQGDEARAMLLARRIADGGGLGVLLWHKKGPLEVLVPLAALTVGDVRESVARLPFAVAGFVAVLWAFALGTRLWGARAGWLAAMILALDGYLIAFSRIVQYQSLVVLLSVVAVWSAVRFADSNAQDRRYLYTASAALGVGTWAHYEMLLIAPAVAFLIVSCALSEKWPLRKWLAMLTGPVALGVAICAVFYVPFVRHPQFGRTADYIVGRRMGGGLYNMLGDYFARASFYNASYYVMLLAVVLGAAIAWRVSTSFGRGGRAVAAIWLASVGLLFIAPGAFDFAGQSLAVLVFAPVAVALTFSRAIPVRWRTVLVWLAVPFLVAAFLTRKPHTHFYTLMPGAALLAGWALDRGLARLEAAIGRARARTYAVVGGGFLFVVFAVHQHVVFIRNTPEYKRVYPSARLAGYWVPYGDERPRGGYFGFPYRAGWREIRALFADGSLHGDYDSNEEALITGWYTWGAVRCAERPRYYIVAWRPQDREDIPLETIEQEYHLRYEVRVRGQVKLRVWDREPVGGPPLQLDDRGGMAALAGPASPYADRSLAVSQALRLPLTALALGQQFGQAATLVGADLPLAGAPLPPPAADLPDSAAQSLLADAAQPAGRRNGASGQAAPLVDGAAYPLIPGGTVNVVLVWSARADMDTNYSSFVHLVDDDGRIVAQSDGWPECGRAPTSAWAVGSPYYDGHVLDLPAVLDPGEYRLQVGLYEPSTGRRLPITGPGDHEGDALTVARFRAVGP